MDRLRFNSVPVHMIMHLAVYFIIAELYNVVLSPGSRSFHRRSLHYIGDGLNPYEQAISIIGKTLAAFDEDNLIPCYGFGDGTWSIIFCLLSSTYLSKWWKIISSSVM